MLTHKPMVAILGAALVCGSLAFMSHEVSAQGTAASPSASAAPPDFSGVYYPIQEGRGRGSQAGTGPAAASRGGPPARPTQSAPLSDGSQGRSPTAPLLTPEYMARWEIMRKSRIAGSYEFDNNAKCLPPGMPAMMNMAYGMEVMQTKDKITFFSELNDALRRVYLDGRKPTQKQLDDPTYAGYSTGHWEGDTLAVETVALHPNSFIEGFTPHSDAMTVKERIRFTGPGLLEDRITVNDPKALTQPWETVHTYRKSTPPKDELREFACAEGLTRGK
ncbi:MAG: hypothetical protein C5B57_03990 [Blastocatellia bacterium]|nr:MAG: hypothetical protein C5B57_03990 [Blastocatellia bacterium]